MHWLLGQGDVTVVRGDGTWIFTRHTLEPVGVFTDDYEMTDEQVLTSGPMDMPSAELAKIATALGKEPMDMSWYRNRLLRERIVSDDVEGTRALLDEPRAAYLTLAIDAKVWKVAADLVEKGAPLVSLHKEWTAPDFVVHRLDDGGLRLLDLLDLKPLDGLLRLAQTPGVVRKLVALGSAVDAVGPAGHSISIGPVFDVATPLMIAVQHLRFDVADALLDAGASLEVRDEYGRTVVDFITWMGRKPAIEWLQQRVNR